MKQAKITSVLTFKYKYWGKISKAKIRSVWNGLYPNRCLPKIMAFIVSKEEFLNFKNQWEKPLKKYGVYNALDINSFLEYGVPFSAEDTTASVVKIRVNGKKAYLVLVVPNLVFTLEQVLQHEFSHIHDGELDGANIKRRV